MLLEIDPKKKKVSSMKRIFIFLIDALSAFILFLSLFLTVGNLTIKEIEKDNISNMNIIFKEICDNENLPYSNNNQYNLYELDYETYMDKLINEGNTSDKAYELYLESENKLNEKLSLNTDYVNYYNSFYITYKLASIISMFISLFLLQFLIPLLSKKNSTLSMKLFKTTIVNSKDSVIISKNQILLRFFIIFITEYICVFLLVEWIGLIFVILTSFFSISISKRKATIHDLVMKTQLNYIEYSYTE